MIVRPWCARRRQPRFDVFHEDVDTSLLRDRSTCSGWRCTPMGLPRVGNLPEWGRHITESLRVRQVPARILRSTCC